MDTVSKLYTREDVMERLGLSSEEFQAAVSTAGVDLKRPSGQLDQAEFEALLYVTRPFGIVTTHRDGDAFSRARLDELMRSKGGVQTVQGTVLRFKTEEGAQATLTELIAESGEEYWALKN